MNTKLSSTISLFLRSCPSKRCLLMQFIIIIPMRLTSIMQMDFFTLMLASKVYNRIKIVLRSITCLSLKRCRFLFQEAPSLEVNAMQIFIGQAIMKQIELFFSFQYLRFSISMSCFFFLCFKFRV